MTESIRVCFLTQTSAHAKYPEMCIDIYQYKYMYVSMNLCTDTFLFPLSLTSVYTHIHTSIYTHHCLISPSHSFPFFLWVWPVTYTYTYTQAYTHMTTVSHPQIVSLFLWVWPVYIHTYTHTYTYTQAYTHIHTYIHIHTSIYTRDYRISSSDSFFVPLSLTRVYIHTYIHTHINTHIHTHTCRHARKHTHMTTVSHPQIVSLFLWVWPVQSPRPPQTVRLSLLWPFLSL